MSKNPRHTAIVDGGIVGLTGTGGFGMELYFWLAEMFLEKQKSHP